MPDGGDTYNTVSGSAHVVVQGRDIGAVNVHLPAARETPARVRVGVLPRQADCFQDRQIALQPPDSAEQDGSAMRCHVLAGLGGVGKTQLAAAYARRAWEQGVGVLVWVTAATRSAIIEGYAEAAAQLGNGDRDDLEKAAERFIMWAETTDISWLVVMDDLQNPADVRGLWPPDSAVGRVLVTTRRRDAVLTRSGRAVVQVGLFTLAEARTFLTAKLGSQAADLASIDGLAADLGWLPLALAQAAAFIVDQAIDCVAYRELLAERLLAEVVPEPDGLPDDHDRIVTATWELSIERADLARPAGLARPVLELVSMLDPNGIPSVVLTSPPARSHLAATVPTAQEAAPGPIVGPGHDDAALVDQEKVAGALRVLHRFSLIDHDPLATHREIRVHQLVQRVTRESLPVSRSNSLARVAANSVAAVWRTTERDELGQALRANTAALRQAAGDALWDKDSNAHDVLMFAANTFGQTGQVTAAINAFAELTATAEHHLGRYHLRSLQSRHDLAAWRSQAGDISGAAAALTGLMPDLVRVLGPDHLTTLRARNNLAYCRASSGDPAGAATALEELLPDMVRVLGPDHPTTLSTRRNLARWRGTAGDTAGAVAALEELLPDMVRVLGPDHSIALSTRHNLALFRGKAGDASGAAAACQELLSDELRVLGPDHPTTLTTRADLAYWCGETGDVVGAATATETLLADRVRVLGPDHPDTLMSRNNLAYWRGHAGNVAGAVAAFEELMPDVVRVLGPDHPTAVTVRRNLALWRQRVDLEPGDHLDTD